MFFTNYGADPAHELTPFLGGSSQPMVASLRAQVDRLRLMGLGYSTTNSYVELVPRPTSPNLSAQALKLTAAPYGDVPFVLLS